MNKIFLLLLLSVSCLFSSQLTSNIVANTAFHLTVAFYHHQNLPTSLLVLDDETVWEIFNPPMIKRDPDAEDPLFHFKLSDWEKPMSVGIETYQWILDSEMSENDDSSINFIKRRPEVAVLFPYVVENLETGKFAFARPVSAVDVIYYFLEYSKAEYDRGHDIGFERGCQVLESAESERCSESFYRIS